MQRSTPRSRSARLFGEKMYLSLCLYGDIMLVSIRMTTGNQQNMSLSFAIKA